MNQIILKGNVGQDPEYKVFESGGQVCKFSLATSEKYKNREGEQVTQTDWHNIVFYGKIADTINKYVKKGNQLLITGKVKYRSYDDKEGKTIWVTEIIGDRFEFCGSISKSESKPENKEGEYQGNSKSEKQSGPPYDSGYSNIDDLPGHVKDAEESQNMDESPF